MPMATPVRLWNQLPIIETSGMVKTQQPNVPNTMPEHIHIHGAV